MTTNSGTLCYDADFSPYGGERAFTNSCPTGNNYKFEGKERDTETGNDDFGARYYSNRFGRWLSANWSSVPAPVPYANLSNPQTLNLYAMVSDDPESFADLDGHEGIGGFHQGNRGSEDARTYELGGSGDAGGEDNASPSAADEFSSVNSDAADQQADQSANQPAQNTNAQLQGPFVADLKSPQIAPLLDPNHKLSTSDVVGPNGECVDLTKKFSGMSDVGTFQWRAGPKVVDDKDIKPGTAIATFDKGRYPQTDVNKNSGIYLGRGANGSVWILDQWPARNSGQKVHPPQPRELLRDSRNVSNDSHAYYVIYAAPR